jgi:hypothetical protein
VEEYELFELSEKLEQLYGHRCSFVVDWCASGIFLLERVALVVLDFDDEQQLDW